MHIEYFRGNAAQIENLHTVMLECNPARGITDLCRKDLHRGTLIKFLWHPFQHI